MRRPILRSAPWLRLEHIVAIKLGLAVVFVATYLVPHPWSEVMALSANMVWLFKT